VEEEVSPLGAVQSPWQQHPAGTKDRVPFCGAPWTRESVPFCGYPELSQKLRHQDRPSDPLRHPSSHALSPYMCELRVSPNPFAFNCMTAKRVSVLAPVHVLSPPLLVGWLHSQISLVSAHELL